MLLVKSSIMIPSYVLRFFKFQLKLKLIEKKNDLFLFDNFTYFERENRGKGNWYNLPFKKM